MRTIYVYYLAVIPLKSMLTIKQLTKLLNVCLGYFDRMVN